MPFGKGSVDSEKADADEVVVSAKALTNRQAKTKRKARLEKDPVKKERLEKRSERQAARQKRKEIRKSKREEIKKTRKSPAKTKKYIQDKESKIEGKAVRIIGSGSGKVLASRNKKEVGKKYKK
jgi:colicin import membrane protein